MPAPVVFVTGTGTGVGKTWAAAGLARTLGERGIVASALKPLQSYDPAGGDPTDAEVLAGATGQAIVDVCPPERTYPVPLAPPMAAAKLARPCPGLDELADACRCGDEIGVILVEGVGGLFSPLACDGHNLDLIERIEPDLVVVVASAALGAIHDTLACTRPLAGRRTAVFLNRFNPQAEIHSLNLDWLRGEGLEVAASLAAMVDIVVDLIGRKATDE